MATPPQNDDITRINAPLNFRHTDTLITTKVPQYPPKLTTGMSIIPGWNRPNANGQNANIVDKDYNGPDFKARPLKHWRKQLHVNDYNGPANNSRAASIADLDRPGTTVYHFTPDCTCVAEEGGNAYIVSNNKFGYETKDDNYSKGVIDVKIQNNGYITVPYDATEEEVNDPANPAYKVLTGVYNTNCINCSPQGNLIKSGVALQSQAFYSSSNDKLESRCQTYEQNISLNKATGCNYFDNLGIPLWPNDTPNGPQVVAPVNYGSIIYKGNFFNLYEYGYNGIGIGAASEVNSANFTPKIKCNPNYAVAGFYVNISPTTLLEATIYDSTNLVICKSTNTQYSYLNANPPTPPSFSVAARIFYFPKNIFLEPSKSYYVKFKTINSVIFDWLVYNDISGNNLSGVLVAEPIYCPSQTIYKPNNVAFGRQGAVSGSARLKKLVSDTMTMNGCSFYSAKGAQEANFGKYQGTNLSSNYYIKTSSVIDSCRGTVPVPPVVRVIDQDSYSITFSWKELGNSICGIDYYTVTYYAVNIIERIRDGEKIQDFLNNNEDVVDIQDFFDVSINNNNNNNNNEIIPYNSQNIFTKNGVVNNSTIYTDNENNIRFNIISEIKTTNVEYTPDPLTAENIAKVSSLTPDTYYLMNITSTNGNGTSIRSNAVLSSTLLHSEIKIDISPLSVLPNIHTYSYNFHAPIILTVTLTSLHNTTPIRLEITNASNVNVAVVSKLEVSQDNTNTEDNTNTNTNTEDNTNIYIVSLNNAGTFNLLAIQERGLGEFTRFGETEKLSPLVTISKDNPVFDRSWDPFHGMLYIGKTINLTPPTFLYPEIVPNDLVIISYEIIPDDYESDIDIITFKDNFSKITINSAGSFKIKATSSKTQNYNSVSITSESDYSTSMNDPIIEFPQNITTYYIYEQGLTFHIIEADVKYPPPLQSSINIDYSILPINTADIATIDGTTVTVHNTGSFIILAETKKTSAYNIARDSYQITIGKADPIILEPYNLFTDGANNLLFTGKTYDFNDPIFAYPSPGLSFPSEIPPFKYTIENTSNPPAVNQLIGKSFKIENEGSFIIKAETSESRNYNKVIIESAEQHSRITTAVVDFPSNFITEIEYGKKYIIKEAEFLYPKDIQEIPGEALLSNSIITVNNVEQFNYFIIGRTLKAVTSSDHSINVTITNKKIILASGVVKHDIYITNNTPEILLPSNTTITNITQYISNPRDFNIEYSIVTIDKEVATINNDGTDITIKGVGQFRIRAHTTQTTQTNQLYIIKDSTMDSPLITVNKATPTVTLGDLFKYTLQVGDTYKFNHATIHIDNNSDIPQEILPITYTSMNPDIVTIVNPQPIPPEIPSLKVIKKGKFKIKAETTKSINYNIGSDESHEELSTEEGHTMINFDPSQNFGPFTYGETHSFTIDEVKFEYPHIQHDEIVVVYKISETHTASIEGRNVKIFGAGKITITAQTIKSDNYSISNLLEKEITIEKAEPEFEAWDIFSNARSIAVGQTFELTPPVFKYPLEDKVPEALREFTYASSSDTVAEISEISGSYFVTVKKSGGFRITARTPGNIDYKATNIPSNEEYIIEPNKTFIEFPRKENGFITEITYGDTYNLKEVVFKNPSPFTDIIGNATLVVTSSSQMHILLENVEQYNLIYVNASLTVHDASGGFITFLVDSKQINSGFIVNVSLLRENVEGNIPIGNKSITKITQYMNPPAGITIDYSIEPPKNPIPSYTPVATISGTNVTINRAGSFRLMAVTEATVAFQKSEVIYSSFITVNKATPTIAFDNIYKDIDNYYDLFKDTDMIVGQIYTFKPAIVTIPTGVNSENIDVNYKCIPEGLVTILNKTQNSVSIQVNTIGEFKIRATTVETANFKSVTIDSKSEQSARSDTPVISFPDKYRNASGNFVDTFTYGYINPNTDINPVGIINIYTPTPAEFKYPQQNVIPSDLNITYTIGDAYSSIATIVMKDINVISKILQNQTYTKQVPVITIKKVGIFILTATTNSTNVYKSSSISMVVTVSKANPTFQTWNALQNNPSYITAGNTYKLIPPTFLIPSPAPSDLASFIYQSSNTSVARINSKIVNGVEEFNIDILTGGQFSITATTGNNINYNTASITSPSPSSLYTSQKNTPSISFPNDFVSVITYGETYNLKKASFTKPSADDIQKFGLYISYYIPGTYNWWKFIQSQYASIDASGNNTIIKSAGGTFTIVARTNNTDAFNMVSITQTVTINKATPTIGFPEDIFPSNDVLFLHNTYTFSPATIKAPTTVPTNELVIKYKSGNVNATVNSDTRQITIVNTGTIKIIAYTEGTNNFNPNEVSYSKERGIETDEPAIDFPDESGGFISNMTLGSISGYSVPLATFKHPSPADAFLRGLSIKYESTDTDVAQIDQVTNKITLLKNGSFKIIATTVEKTTNIFKVITLLSPEITVTKATPTIAFKNSDNTDNTDKDLFRNIDMIVGQIYKFIPAKVTIPNGIASEIITVNYTCIPPGVVTIFDISQNSVSIEVMKQNAFTINATTIGTARFESVSIDSKKETGVKFDTPHIYFQDKADASGNFVDTFTYGVTNNIYTPTPAVFEYPQLTFIPSTGLKITYSIDDASSSIASIPNPDIPAIAIKKVGIFTLTATTNQTTVYKSSSISMVVTVLKGTPTFNTSWNPFSSTASVNPPVYPGTTYDLILPTFIAPPPSAALSENLSFNVNSFSVKSGDDGINPDNIASILSSIVNGVTVFTVRICGVGKFYIQATSNTTDNYNAGIINSIEEVSVKTTPSISFPTNFVEKITYGDNYILNEAYFTTPIPSNIYWLSTKLIISYSITSGNSVAEISTDGTTINIKSAGTFEISAQTNPTDAFNSVVIKKSVTVKKATPIIGIPADMFINVPDNSLLIDHTYAFEAATITGPTTVSTSELVINYKTGNNNATIDLNNNKRTITINNIGPIEIIAYTAQTDNFESSGDIKDSNYKYKYKTVSITSNQLHITEPSILDKDNKEVTTVTYGESYTLKESTFTYPEHNITSLTSRGLSITYKISEPSVANIVKINNINTITLFKSGKFTIIAKTVQAAPAASAIFMPDTKTSGTITVNKANVIFGTAWNPTTDTVLFIGDLINITPPTITTPSDSTLVNGIQPLSYSYITYNNSVGTSIRDSTSFLLPSIMSFRLKATTKESDQYKTTEIESSVLSNTSLRTPVIEFNSNIFTSTVAISDDKYQLESGGISYTLASIVFKNTNNNNWNPQSDGVNIVYSIFEPSNQNVATISGTTILKTNNVGTFKIRATTTRGTNNYYDEVSIISTSIRVNQRVSKSDAEKPNISGTAIVGSILTLNNKVSVWSGDPFPTFSYYWYRKDSSGNSTKVYNSSGDDIFYITKPEDIGKNIVCIVKGKNVISEFLSQESNSILINYNPSPEISLSDGRLVFKGNASLTSSPKFIREDPRGTGLEWFAVVDDRSKNDILDYAKVTNPKPLNALKFNGSTNAVDLGVPSWANSDKFIKTMTVEFWFRTSDTSDQKGASFITRNFTGGSSDSSQFTFYMIPTGQIGFGITNNTNNGFYHNTTIAYKDTYWHHVAGTYDYRTGQKIIYIDGVAARIDTSGNFGLLSNRSSVRLVIGSDDAGIRDTISDHNFRGSIADVRIWNVVRYASEIKDNYLKQLVGNEPGLVFYTKLNQGIASSNNEGITTTQNDMLSGENTGTLCNFTLSGDTSNWVSGPPILTLPLTYVNALNFNGSNNAVDLGVPTWTYSPQFRTTMTIECWFKTTDTYNQKTYPSLVTRNRTGYLSTESQFSIYMLPTGQIGFGITNNNNNGFYHNTTIAYKDTNWHHVAGTYDSTTGQKIIYIDGVAARIDTSGNFGLLSDNSSVRSVRLVIGSDDYGIAYSSSDRNFRGSIADVRIWNVVRSASQIQNNYITQLFGNETGLVFYTKLNQGIASGSDNTRITTTQNDMLSGGNTGTLINFTLSGDKSNWVLGPPVRILPVNALNFNGSNNAVDLGVPTWTYSEQFRTTMTVECWFRTSDTNNQNGGSFVTRNQTGGISTSSQFTFYMEPTGEIGFGLTNASNTGSYHKTTQTYKDTLWHHAAVTYSSFNNVKSIYIDGALIRSDIVPSGFGLLSNNSSVRLVIGSDDAGVYLSQTNRQFRGSIADVRIWNVVRSASEIKDNYLKQLVGNEPGLVFYAKLDQGIASSNNEGITTTQNNTLSGENTGTLRNFTLSGNTSNWVLGPPILTLPLKIANNTIPFNNIVTTLMTDMSYMFNGVTTFNQLISSWDTLKVKNMSSMFQNATAFNQDIGNWSTENVTNMSSMFQGATAFNGNIGSWKTFSVTNMSYMFNGATAFNQFIGSWYTSNVLNMSSMFSGASKFNNSIGWNTNKVVDMSNMFNGASSFNNSISFSDTISVKSMNNMFSGATVFNQDIGNWNTQNVTNMSSMFQGATAFNKFIGNWITQNVKDMGFMFSGATAFNLSIGSWNTSNVLNMSSMFNDAKNFNQNISTWYVSQLSDRPYNFKTNSGLFDINEPYWETSISLLNNITLRFNGNIPATTDANPFFIPYKNPTNRIEFCAVMRNTTDSIGLIRGYVDKKSIAIVNDYVIPFNRIVTTFMTDMSGLFSTTTFNNDISTWDTANVTNMGGMFYESRVFNQPIGNWNTSKVTTMVDMFKNALKFDQDISSWDTSKVLNMSSMFNGASVFNKPIGIWNTQNVTDMSYMFNGATAFNQDISSWNVSNVSPKPPPSFNIGSALSITNSPWQLLLDANGITIKYIGLSSDISGSITFKERYVRGSKEWFAIVNNIAQLMITYYAKGISDGINAFTPPGQTSPVPFNNIVTTHLTNMDNIFNNAFVFNQPIESWDTSNVTTMSSMFNSATAFNQPISMWDTSKVLNMSSMFNSATAFNQFIGNWNTSSVTNMSSMFNGATAFNQPISMWNTSNVTDMGFMFSGATAFNQYIGNWNTQKVKNMSYMFNGAKSFNQAFDHTRLTIRYGNTDWQQRIINNDTTDTNIQYWNPDQQWIYPYAVPQNQIALQFRFYAAYVTKLYNIRSGSATVFVSGGNIGTYSFTWNGSTGYTGRFYGEYVSWDYTLPSDISINTKGWNTSSVTNMSSMFSGAQIFNNDITRWDTSNVTDMSYMFSNAYDFNQPIFSYWDTQKVTNMAFMFAYATTFNNAGVTNAIAGSWNTSNVTNMSYMFLNCFKFNTPIGGWNTSKVTNMSFMFANNYIFNQPIGGWDTSQVTDMTNMFQNCTAFNQPIGNWNTSKVTSMQAMFASAVSFNNGFSPVTNLSGYLTTGGWYLRYYYNQLPINSINDAQRLNWDVSQVTNMHIMFIGASSLFNVFIAHWNVRDDLYFEGFRRDCPIPDEFTPYKIVSQGGGR